MKNNELSKQVKESKHTTPLKNNKGKAVGHVTTEKKEGKNFKAEHSVGHAKEDNYEMFMESFSAEQTFDSEE